MRILDVHANAMAAIELVRLLKRRRSLLVEMTRRELSDRYAGQVLGVAWAVLTPLLTISTYLLAFGLIFKGRLGPIDDGSAYMAYLLAGLVPWMMITECLSRAATAISGHASLVKQIVFPSELLPMKVTLAALPGFLIGTAITVVLGLAAGVTGLFGLFVMLPLAIFFLVLLIAGLAFMLAAVGVFVRDVKDIVTYVLSVGLFLHPILYPPQSIPGWLAPWFAASPFSHVIWCFRDSILGAGSLDHPWSWLVFPLVSVMAFAIGGRTFRALKPAFGNAL